MSLVVLFTVFIIFVIVLSLSLSKKPRKTAPYAGGEKLELARVEHPNFYNTLYRLFPKTFRLLERIHDDNLHNYIFLVLLTTSLLLLLTMLPGWF